MNSIATTTRNPSSSLSCYVGVGPNVNGISSSSQILSCTPPTNNFCSVKNKSTQNIFIWWKEYQSSEKILKSSVLCMQLVIFVIRLYFRDTHFNWYTNHKIDDFHVFLDDWEILIYLYFKVVNHHKSDFITNFLFAKLFSKLCAISWFRLNWKHFNKYYLLFF